MNYTTNQRALINGFIYPFGAESSTENYMAIRYTSWNIKTPPRVKGRKARISLQSRMEQGQQFKALYASLSFKAHEVAQILQVSTRSAQNRVRVTSPCDALLHWQVRVSTDRRLHGRLRHRGRAPSAGVGGPGDAGASEQLAQPVPGARGGDRWPAAVQGNESERGRKSRLCAGAGFAGCQQPIG